MSNETSIKEKPTSLRKMHIIILVLWLVATVSVYYIGVLMRSLEVMWGAWFSMLIEFGVLVREARKIRRKIARKQEEFQGPIII